MKKSVLLFFITVLFFWACQEKPKNLIPRPVYKQVLKEIILADLIQQKYPKKDSLGDMMLLVYKKYKVDSISLKNTTDYYSRHPNELAEIYTEIYTEFKQKSDSLEKLVPDKKPKTDKINVKKSVFGSKNIFKKGK